MKRPQCQQDRRLSWHTSTLTFRKDKSSCVGKYCTLSFQFSFFQYMNLAFNFTIRFYNHNPRQCIHGYFLRVWDCIKCNTKWNKSRNSSKVYSPKGPKTNVWFRKKKKRLECESRQTDHELGGRQRAVQITEDLEGRRCMRGEPGVYCATIRLKTIERRRAT